MFIVNKDASRMFPTSRRIKFKFHTFNWIVHIKNGLSIPIVFCVNESFSVMQLNAHQMYKSLDNQTIPLYPVMWNSNNRINKYGKMKAKANEWTRNEEEEFQPTDGRFTFMRLLWLLPFHFLQIDFTTFVFIIALDLINKSVRSVAVLWRLKE